MLEKIDFKSFYASTANVPMHDMNRTLSVNSPPVIASVQHETYIFPRPQKSSLIKKVIFDVLVVLILGLSILFFNLFAKPYKRGFNCNDDSIRYPYKFDTITTAVLVSYSIVIPLVTIIINEFFVVRYAFSQDKVNNFFGSLHFWTCLFWQWYMQVIPFLFAAATSQMITEISKYSIGRLRPHFIDLCQPVILSGKLKDLQITRFSNCGEPFSYIEDYECHNPTALPKFLKDVHLSFMSGHSSFSSVCLVYLVFYLQSRFNWTSVGLVKHLYQVGLVFLVFYTGMSRISDYKHHWSDVLTGLIQGTLVAIIVATFVSDLVRLRSFYKSPNSLQQEKNGSRSSNINRDSNV